MLSKLFRIAFVVIVCASLVSADIKRHYEPEYPLWGNPEKHKFDPVNKEYINYNYIIDNWVFQEMDNDKRQRMIDEMKRPSHMPAKTKYEVVVKFKLFRKPDSFFTETMALGAMQKRRLVLVNPEGNTDMPLSVRCHPHAGLLAAGTAAAEFCEVILWDELVQGRCSLGTLVQPGDIVGFSLVITGVERGVELARQAKQLGAAAVMAGNDSAIFRSNQLLSLPGKPFDAVFTSNSLNSLQQFLQEFNGSNIHQLHIPEFQTRPGGVQHSNTKQRLMVELQSRKALKAAKQFDPTDGFIIPDFSLFPAKYWETTWRNFREVYGHKHLYGKEIRNALGLLAQGCTRTQGTTACEYCSIFGVGDVRVPSREYLAATLDAYNKFRITEFYNVTDSAFEMTPLISSLEDIGAEFDALTIYARAQGVATNPQLLDRWLACTRHRLQLNVGMDSGDPGMLASGIIKSSVAGLGSRLEENRQTVLGVLQSGAHLHYSMIFGAPGETRESCERTVEFVEWTITTLGQQLDLVESDLFWLNFGSPASQVFTNYTYAQSLAAKAGKSITRIEWWQHFGSQSQQLVVPWATERAWYEFFTNISLDTAQEFNARVTKLMQNHTGSIGGRAFFPRAKEV